MLTNLCHKQTVGLSFFLAVVKPLGNTYGACFQVEHILFLQEAFQMTADVTQPV